MRTHVGQYRIEAPLGRGGMGVVYRGVHEHLGRQVAIKALAPELTQQPEFKERFFAEAKTQARLQHPNVVGVYDLIEDGGEYFIVMEFVSGEPLDDRLKTMAGRGMDLQEALAVFGQVLAALDYAHSEGVIHRDIKPSNVLITPGGRVKLTDFGIALLIGDKRLTASHSAIGTPTYMSPEQIVRPRSVDHRTDIYSAAVVFYEMLAGKPPFDGETEYEIKKLHVEAPPDLASLASGLPAGVVQAISTALSKDANDRFSGAGAFLRALQEAAPGAVPAGATPLPAPVYRPTSLDSTGWTGPGSTPAPSPPPSPAAGSEGQLLSRLMDGRNRWITLGAAAVLVLAIGFGAILLILRMLADDPSPAGTAVLAENAPPAGMAPAAAAVALPQPADQLPVSEMPAGASPTTSLSSPPMGAPQSPPANLAGMEPQRQEPAASPPEPRPSTPRKRETKPAAPPPPQENRPEPQAPPAPAEAEPEPAPSSTSAGVEHFNEMNDVIVNIERLGKKTLEAYEEEEREDELASWLEDFVETAEETRKEFRGATGTGLRGMKKNLTGMFRNQGGREADTKVLEVKAQDLIRQGAQIDKLMASSSPGQVTAQYWQEVRRYLRQLDGFF